MRLSFKYHMYGGSMGSLKVSANGNQLWKKDTATGNKWLEADIDLSQFVGANPVIEFVGTRGRSWQGDAAIDQVRFTALGKGTTQPPARPTPMPAPPVTTTTTVTTRPVTTTTTTTTSSPAATPAPAPPTVVIPGPPGPP